MQLIYKNNLTQLIMETQEQPLSEQESLRIISQMIQTAKENFNDNGFFYLLWGWLVFIAALTQFCLIHIQYELNYMPWPVLMTAGGIISFIYGYRQEKKAKVKTHLDSFMGYLWGGFVISLLIVLGMMPKISVEVAYPIIMILYGLGTFVSGGVLKFTPLILGGITCWAIAIISLFFNFEIQLLLIAFAVLLSYIIPGHMLKHRYSKYV